MRGQSAEQTKVDQGSGVCYAEPGGFCTPKMGKQGSRLPNTISRPHGKKWALVVLLNFEDTSKKEKQKTKTLELGTSPLAGQHLEGTKGSKSRGGCQP